MKIERYGNTSAETVLIQPVDEHDLSGIQLELEEIRRLTDVDFCLWTLRIEDWNRELSPWKAPAVFGNEDFGNGAEETLREILGLCDDRSRSYVIGGYSLAGLFALWAAWQTDVFDAVAAASPSVWFPGFADHVGDRMPGCDRIYLSLGDKEEKARNPVMATVGDRIRELYYDLRSKGTDCILEWNPGNHFKDPAIRSAKAFAWVLNRGGSTRVASKQISFPHGFSTRFGGVSSGIFASLNLGMNRGDDAECVKENYKRFFRACGIESRSFVCGRQVHGNHVMIVDEKAAKEPYGYKELFEADGYVTNTPNVPLVVFTADCIPLLLADEKNRVIASVHSGWRGTVKDIERQAVEKMQSLGAETGYIKACIGPAIGKCCFEVGGEVVEAVKGLLNEDASDLYRIKENGKYMLDLKTVVKRCLLRSGLKEENIEIIDDCTMCMPQKYWSHRYTGGERGSQAAVIMIPGEKTR
ncbi:MAG: peptidoglycan editing factor PgeF [Lachnospiraceae bacterium]|nr:peptidoglycan editing factor PgeF [Lachnospiraceae bacterium]